MHAFVELKDCTVHSLESIFKLYDGKDFVKDENLKLKVIKQFKTLVKVKAGCSRQKLHEEMWPYVDVKTYRISKLITTGRQQCEQN